MTSPSMVRRRRRVRAVALLACLLTLSPVTAAACSTSADGKGVASVGGSATPGMTPSLSGLDQLIMYTRCMREHGVPMSDPEVDGDAVRQSRYDKDAVSRDTEIKAEEACKRYRPPQETGPEMDFKNELQRQFSRCMREHGVENFPDPNPDGPTRIDESIGEDPQYGQARPICDAQVAAAFASFRPGSGATR
jgi:hypothetical protein